MKQPLHMDTALKQGFSQEIHTYIRFYLESLKDSMPKGHLYGLILNQVEKALFEEVMLFTKENQSVAAEILGINRNTLRKKLQSLNIIPPAFPSKRKKT